MTDNTSVDFLLDGSDISLTLLFVLPDKSLPEVIPDHDVAFVALSASQRNNSVLGVMQEIAKSWPRPVLNRPEFMTNCLRDTMSNLLSDINGLLVPVVKRMSLLEVTMSTFPSIIRPIDTQGGVGLAKIDSKVQLGTYLRERDDVAFYVSEFIPFQSGDGLYRKYRVALIEGVPFACHMAISGHWMVHYFSANMHSSEAKRSEEKEFMENFENGFGRKHASALAEIYGRLKLDYLVLDCAETADGNLLVFEVDSVSWIHDTDPIEIFPYKPPVMRKAFDAFISMVHRTSKLNMTEDAERQQ